jgi:hypothetical protein
VLAERGRRAVKPTPSPKWRCKSTLHSLRLSAEDPSPRHRSKRPTEKWRQNDLAGLMTRTWDGRRAMGHRGAATHRMMMRLMECERRESVGAMRRDCKRREQGSEDGRREAKNGHEKNGCIGQSAVQAHPENPDHQPSTQGFVTRVRILQHMRSPRFGLGLSPKTCRCS